MSAAKIPEVVRRPPRNATLLDLHNHTDRSYDAANRYDDYEAAHARGAFDVLAITDHNTIDGAREFAARDSFRTIVGEEVDTADGELIGLFLEDAIPKGMSAADTARAIREQGGIVYLQHPFYPYIRRRLGRDVIRDLCMRGLLDVVEGLNGGPLMRSSDAEARDWAKGRDLPCGAGSDAHYPGDIGTCVAAVPRLTEAEIARLDGAGLVARLRHGVLVERRRASASGLSDRVRYLAREKWRCRMHGGRRKLRVPQRGARP